MSKTIPQLTAADTTEYDPLAGGAALHKWLGSQGIVKGSLRRPSRDACENLCRSLQGLQIACNVGERWRKSNLTSTGLRGALRTLDDLLPKRISELQEAMDLDQGSVFSRFIKVELDILLSLKSAVDSGLSRPSAMGILIEPFDRWHNFAWPLTEAFQDAMRTTNHGTKLRISNTGPVVRFLQAIIPHLSGEKPTMAAIARQLQRTSPDPRG